MAIKQWEENGKTLYRIDVCVYSRADTSIRKQKRVQGSLDEPSSDATTTKLQRIEERLKEDAQREIFELEAAGILWRDLAARWEKDLQREMNDKSLDASLVKKRGARTAHGYIQCVQDFTEQWSELPASQITPADVEDLFKRMARMGYSNCRQYNVKVAINQVFRYGIMRRLVKGVSVSPTYGFGISRKESKRPEILNGPQIEQLLLEAKRRNHPWRTIWEGAYHLGFRSGEGQELRFKDVDLVERLVCFERQYNSHTRQIDKLKDGEWRQVSINEDAYELFIELGASDKKPDDHVFPRINAWKNGETARHLRAFCEEIGIPSICFHTLRACWATHLLRNGVDRVTVMAMGGWSDLETMERYIRLAGTEIKGATDSLSIRKKERPGRVLKLVGTN